METIKNLQFYRCMLDAGHVAFSNEPTLLSSVCGNGVIVTVWDRRRHFGGMVHCVFGARRFREMPTNYHADVAIPVLLRQFSSCSSYFGHLEAQIFGGGSLRGSQSRRAFYTIRSIRRILKNFHIAIASEDVGGSVGRKIIFNTFSGDAMVLKTKKIRLRDWAPEYLSE